MQSDNFKQKQNQKLILSEKKYVKTWVIKLVVVRIIV